MAVYFNKIAMLRNSNNIYFLKLNFSSLTNYGEILETCCRIPNVHASYGQTITKIQFSAVLNRFLSYFQWYFENIYYTNIWLQCMGRLSIYFSPQKHETGKITGYGSFLFLALEPKFGYETYLDTWKAVWYSPRGLWTAVLCGSVLSLPGE